MSHPFAGYGLTALALLAATSCAPAPARAQASSPAPAPARATPPAVAAVAPAGLFTAEQAEAGKKVFEASCVSCHLADLTGKDDAPPLSGPYFASSWGGHKVSELVDFVRGNMPFTAPGSLSDESYVRVVAYVLSRNWAPAGDAPLVKDASAPIPAVKD